MSSLLFQALFFLLAEAAVWRGFSIAAPVGRHTNVVSGHQTLFWIFVGVQIAFATLLVVMQGAKHLSRRADLSGTVVPAITQ